MMKSDVVARSRFLLVAVTVLAVLAASTGSALAAFPAMYGARAMGMGGAFTAVTDDSTALYWNPAALGRSTLSANLGLGVSGTGNLEEFQRLSSNPEDLPELIQFEGEASAGVGLLLGANIGSIGVGYLVDGDMQLKKQAGTEFDGRLELRQNIALGAARDFAGVRLGAVLRSVNAERARHTVDGSGNTTANMEETGTGYALDLGALLPVSDVFSVGAAVRNVVGETKWQNAAETPETEFRVGVALKPPLFGGTIAVDIASGGQFRYGIEKKLLFGGLRLRAGQIHSDADTWTTAGVGFALGPIAIETAAIMQGQAVHYAIEAALRF